MTQVKQMQLKAEAKPLTTAVVLAFYQGSDAAKTQDKVTQLELPRVKHLFSFFPATDISTVRSVVKDIRTLASKQKDGTVNRNTPEYRSASNRASELQAIYGAWRFAGCSEPSGGYQNTLAAARDALKAKQIRWTGEHVLDKVEREVKADASIIGAQAQAVAEARLMRERRGQPELTEEEAHAIAQKESDTIRQAGAREMAGRLFRNQGAEFCGWLIDALEGHIAVVENAPLQGEEKAAA